MIFFYLISYIVKVFLENLDFKTYNRDVIVLLSFHSNPFLRSVLKMNCTIFKMSQFITIFQGCLHVNKKKKILINNLWKELHIMVSYTLQRHKWYSVKLVSSVLTFLRTRIHVSFDIPRVLFEHWELIRALTLIPWCKNRIPFMFSSVMSYENDCYHV